MKGTLTVIRPSAPFTPNMTTSEIDSPPDLTTLKALLDGGWIEVVPRFTHYMGQSCVAFCDEEGKLKGLQYNAVATALWAAIHGRALDDVLVGPVVIITGDRDLLDAI